MHRPTSALLLPLIGLAASVVAAAILPTPTNATEPVPTGHLRLLPPPPSPGGLSAFHVEDSLGLPLSAERAARIDLLAGTDVSQPPDRWVRLGSERSLLDGRLHLTPTVRPAGPSAFFVARETPIPPPITVRDLAGLRAAASAAVPGTRILIAPGTYPGGTALPNLRGTPELPIVLAAADPTHPPVFQGGTSGLQLSDPAHVELQDLVFSGATGNGLNIDDAGSFDSPAHHLVLRRLRILDVGPTGNRDGIKLSGVDHFRVEGCLIERWGSGGSGIDMVGCHDGLIVSNTLRHLPATASDVGNGIQTKGGTRNVVIRRNRLEHAGSRAFNIGGSTGLTLFRPPLADGTDHWEARDIRIEGNTVVGSLSPFAFVGVDGAEVRFNTVYRPQRWVIRILQETTAPGFVPCRNGRFTDNLVVFHSTQWASGGVNIGGNTAPATFTFARNGWYCLDTPSRSRPTLPTPETDGTYGQSPQFRDAEAGDFTLLPGSPAQHLGAAGLPD